MRTVHLTGTSLVTSRLGFGLSALHHALRSKDRQSLLCEAFEHGIRYFDTAPYYGHGLAERELGQFSERRRDQLLIATKCGIDPNPWLVRWPSLIYPRLAAHATLRAITKRSLIGPPPRDFSASAVPLSVENSLRALRCEYIDILYLHEPALDQIHEPQQLIETLQRLQAEGKIRYFGLSGGAQDCMAIATAFPALARVLQIDAASPSADSRATGSEALPVHSTFGHLRAKNLPVAQAMAAAVDSNPDGVILFSTRKPERIRSIADLLVMLEAA